MAYEFFLDAGCPLQARLTPTHFMRAAKIQETLEWINQKRPQWKDQGVDAEARTMVFQYEIETPNGPRSKLTVRELRQAYAQLIATQAHEICGDCPLNLHCDLLGCYGAIKYPISAAAEAWLIEQFDPPDGEEGYIPHHLRSGGVTGQALDQARPRHGEPPQGLLAAAAPATRLLSREGPAISSSQLIEYLLACMPTIQPITLFGLCVDFHAIGLSDDERMEFNYAFALESRLGSKKYQSGMGDFRQKLQQIPFMMQLAVGDDPSIQQFKSFFMHCWVGCLSGSGLAVDG